MVVSMKRTFSEFMGCEYWSKPALCEFIDQLAEEGKARGELIRDMYADKVNEATCLDFSGRRFFMGRDIETINGYRERMEALGIEVDNDESQGS